MRMRERGAVLILALAFMVVVAMLLAVAAQGYARLSESHRAAMAEEAAHLEARNGVRWMAARLAQGGATGPLERTDPAGTLKVRVSDDRIVSEFAAGRRTAVASARWKRAGGIELDDWKDE